MFAHVNNVGQHLMFVRESNFANALVRTTGGSHCRMTYIARLEEATKNRLNSRELAHPELEFRGLCKGHDSLAYVG